MEKNFILNRRTVLGGAAALGTVGVLAACGSSKDSKATTQGATVGTDAKELYDLGEAAVSELKDGGTLRLAIPGIGPDFNLFSADGNSLYTQTAMSPVATQACGRVTPWVSALWLPISRRASMFPKKTVCPLSPLS